MTRHVLESLTSDELKALVFFIESGQSGQSGKSGQSGQSRQSGVAFSHLLFWVFGATLFIVGKWLGWLGKWLRYRFFFATCASIAQNCSSQS